MRCRHGGVVPRIAAVSLVQQPPPFVVIWDGTAALRHAIGCHRGYIILDMVRDGLERDGL